MALQVYIDRWRYQLVAAIAALIGCALLTAAAGPSDNPSSDDAVGTMTKNDKGVFWVSRVVLHPAVTYAGDKRPTPAEEEALHHAAHDQCFISQSVKTEVKVEGVAD